MKQSFYAIIPATVRYDKSLKANAKLLYGEITALCGKEGFCWAGNNYFAELYQVDIKTISRWISQLADAGYISVELFKNKGNKRKIFIGNSLKKYNQKNDLPSAKKDTTLVTKMTLG
ncbi:helix-turn-helix domain-containing protein [Flavobacterium sp. '19STA2R22 D10 B1']|uniref:helix-turn-helix domain-containing protein n=1 Tax=Flavobacterium aerium TaxID=3037261 RepID=UPI00278BE082|nr:helix-turn-helix domain-containing protein [Flavobacterium sp. '19STA2R22 D10 B1']